MIRIQSVPAGIPAEALLVEGKSGGTAFTEMLNGLAALAEGVQTAGKEGKATPEMEPADYLALLEHLQLQLSSMKELKDADPELKAGLEQAAAEILFLLTNVLQPQQKMQTEGTSFQSGHTAAQEPYPAMINSDQAARLLEKLEKAGQLSGELKDLLVRWMNQDLKGSAKADTRQADWRPEAAIVTRLKAHSGDRTILPRFTDQPLETIRTIRQNSNSIPVSPFQISRQPAAMQEAVSFSTRQGEPAQAVKAGLENHEGPGFQVQVPLSKPEQLSLFVKMNPGGSTVSQEHLIQQIQKMMASSRFTAANGSEKLFIKLYPEHLGELRIEIMQSDGKWTAKFTAVTAQVREVIESNLHQLKQGLSQQSIQLDKVEVFQSQPQPGREMPQEQNGRHREQHQHGRKEEPERADFEDSLSEELANLIE